jgi:serine-type D-Ala-D-Ala carboxypeptidase/endopeptidase (penicillin-binding protein 4)
VIRDINKFSNNTMARQLFLTLGTTLPATTPVSAVSNIESSASADAEPPVMSMPPANIARSTKAVLHWLDGKKLQFPELVLENGAGLSRNERISPQHLADLLQQATDSPFSAELEASLPILGMDGSVKKRLKDSEIAGYAHLKTGSLDGVKSIAGYVKAQSGKQWIVVFIINHPNSARGQDAQDALIEWVQRHN